MIPFSIATGGLAMRRVVGNPMFGCISKPKFTHNQFGRFTPSRFSPTQRAVYPAFSTSMPPRPTASLTTIENRRGMSKVASPWQYPHTLLVDIRTNLAMVSMRYRAANEEKPYYMGFIVCCLKGMVASYIAQKAIEGKPDIDELQVLSMALFSGTFCGCGYHFLFNVVGARIFGTSASTAIVFARAAMDGLVIFPFMYMPTFIAFDEVLRYAGAGSGIFVRWRAEIATAMYEYMKIWPPAMVLVFKVAPVELRVSCIAAVSFAWLIILSIFTMRKARSGSIAQ